MPYFGGAVNTGGRDYLRVDMILIGGVLRAHSHLDGEVGVGGRADEADVDIGGALNARSGGRAAAGRQGCKRHDGEGEQGGGFRCSGMDGAPSHRICSGPKNDIRKSGARSLGEHVPISPAVASRRWPSVRLSVLPRYALWSLLSKAQ